MKRKVILCIHDYVGGVDIFSTTMAAELLRRGVKARVLNTCISTQPYSLPLPSHVPVDTLPVKKKDSWPHLWRTLIRYIESQAPCIFIPNLNMKYSCVCSKLSTRIIVVGILHSDDPVHYEHAMRMGKYWNGVISVSNAIAGHLEILRGDIEKKSRIIPYGVEVPTSAPDRDFSSERPLRIVYAGRLAHRQKCVLNLPEIFEKLQAETVPIEITVIGDGPDRSTLEMRCANLISDGIVRFLGSLPNKQVLEYYKSQDAIILTSDYEGMPICLLEAMGRGCVPVVTNTRSGIPELIRDGTNGFLIHRGHTDAFVERFRLLQQNPDLRQSMSRNAHQTIQDKFSLKRMVDDYLDFFNHLEKESSTGLYRRPRGPIPYPPWMKIGWKDYLPVNIRAAGKWGKKLFQRTGRLFHSVPADNSRVDSR